MMDSAHGRSPTDSHTSSQLPSSASGTTMGSGGNARNYAVTRKVQRLLDVTVTDELRTGLDHVGSFYDVGFDGNTPKARKALKSDIDHRTIALHEALLKQWEAVDQKYLEVANDVSKLAAECEKATGVVKSAADESRELMQRVEVLQAEQQETKRKEEQIEQFMKQFQLSRAETEVLKGDVTPQFVEVLHKVRAIHATCKQQMLGAADHQQAAIEVMETMFLAQMSALEHLARYLIHQAGDIFSLDCPEISTLFIDGAAALQDNPGHWMKLLQEIARVRRGANLRRFLEALSKGGAGVGARASSAGGAGIHKPLESQSHDTVRFVGDLCAWLHQAAAEESDTLSCLFGGAGRGNQQQQQPMMSASAQLSKADVLDQVFESVARHFRQRVDQAVAQMTANSSGGASSSSSSRGGRSSGGSSPVMVQLFKLEGVLSFYSKATQELLGENAALSVAMDGLKLDVMRQFFDLLSQTSSQISQRVTSVGSDLHVPAEITNALQFLRQMMETLQGSYLPHAQRESDFAPVLGAIVDPIVSLSSSVELPSSSSFAESATTQKDAPLSAARSVFRINVLCAILSTILTFEFTSAKQAKLGDLLEEEVTKFISSSTDALQRMIGLSRLDGLLSSTTEDINGADVKQSLKDAVQSLYSCAYNSGALPIPHLEHIQPIRLRDRCSRDITSVVCGDYERHFDTLVAKVGKEAASEVFLHSPDQMRVLLDAGASTDSAGTA